MESQYYSEKKYFETQDLVGCDFFIDPDGIMYKVCDKHKPSPMSHSLWAEMYMKNHPELQNQYEDFKRRGCKDFISVDSAIDFLIHYLGWVGYGHSLECHHIQINPPLYYYFGKKITVEQKKLLVNYLIDNMDDNETMNKLLDFIENEYDQYDPEVMGGKRI